MKIKKYFLWIGFGMLIAALSLILSVEISLGSKPEGGRWVAELLDKKSVAIEKKLPKLVILSGSNSLFGFSARILSENYGIETINASIHAGLGLNYILNYARPYIASGRIFVLPLEYPLYGKPSSSGAFLYQVIGFDPRYFRQLNFLEKIKVISAISMTDRARFLRAVVAPQAKNEADGYQSKTLNEWGDETANTIEKRTKVMLASATKNKPQKYSVDDAVWDELEVFIKDVEAAGGKVLLAYPNIYEDSFDLKTNESFFKDINQRANKLGIKFLGNPEKYTFDDSRAFDTNYHQNTIGQVKSTDQLYNDLRQTGLF